MGDVNPVEAAEYVLALKDCTPFLKQRAACDQAAEALAQLQATRDRLADLEVYAAELWDLLRRNMRVVSRDEYGNCQYCKQPAGGARHAHCWWCGLLQPEAANPQHPPECPVGRTLQTDPPARGRAVLKEVERYRVYQRALALQVLAYQRAALDTPAERNALQGLIGIVEGFEESAGDLAMAQEEGSGAE